MIKKAVQTIFALLIFSVISVNSVFAEDLTVSVQVVASGTPVIVDEPEFTIGLENTINWSTPPLANEYYAEVSTDASFGTVVDSSGWTNLLTYTFENLNDDTKYYYRVKSRNISNQEGVWSDVVSSTQDNNNPSSSVKPLAEEINSSTFTIHFDYFDETSGVSQIVLFYRKDNGSWKTYGTYGAVSEITFNSSLVGGDGDYEFYSVAIDLAGNVEYEASHRDTYTVVDTTVPEPEPEPELGPGPTPTPTPTPTSTSFVFLQTVGGYNVKSLEYVNILESSPKITGSSTALKKLTYNLYDDKGSLLKEDYVRSDEKGYFEVQLENLGNEVYRFEIYFIENGTKYSDVITFNVNEKIEVTASGYAFKNSIIEVFYNNTWFKIGSADENGHYNLNFEIPISFSGEMIFKATIGEYNSTVAYDYKKIPDLGKIIFPPILYPSTQKISLDHFAEINGIAVPNSKVKLYLNNEFIEEITVDNTGEFSFKPGKFTEVKQNQIYATQESDNLVSSKSETVFVFVNKYSIPYIYKVGDLVEKKYGVIASYSVLISEILTVAGLFITIFAGLLLASASNISGYYYMLHDWKSFLLPFELKKKVKFQIAGTDLGNKEGLLYLKDPASNKVVVRILIDANGIGYSKKLHGLYNACYIATRNNSWMKAIWIRREFVLAYYKEKLAIMSNDKNINVLFDYSENLFFYPFKRFERIFDRFILFVAVPIALFATVFSAISFYFVASYYSLALIILGFVLLTVCILMVGYHKRIFDMIKWDGY